MTRALLILTIAACADTGQPDPVTCESFITAEYDRGCTQSDPRDGSQWTVEQAIDNCESINTFACDLEWQAMLDCRAELTSCNFQACESQAAAFVNCRMER